MNKKYKITVFTPTFNRSYILGQLYKSLQSQTFCDFEWLIIDDGSVDNTEELVDSWKVEENTFSIRYYKEKNGGKCRAINYALDLAEGELFFTVDSDDYLTDDALEKIVLWEKSIPKDGTYCGVAGNLGTSSNYTPNSRIDGKYFDGTFLDRYHGIDGERAIVIYTDIHRRYKYPVFENEKFMTEAVAWNRIAYEGYKIRFFNDIIWIYEYQEDGLTKAGNRLFLNNPKGYYLWLKEKSIFMNDSLSMKIKLRYSLIIELSTIYNSRKVAEILECPESIVKLILLCRKLLLKENR